MGVDDVGIKAHVGKNFQTGGGEEGEALAVVVVAVQTASPFEIIFVVDKIPGHAVFVETENSAVLIPPAHGHGNALEKFHFAAQLGGNLSVEGEDDADIVIFDFCKGFGQSSDHVAQTAGNGEGEGLGGGKENLCHIATSFSGDQTRLPFSMTMG